MRLGLSDRSPAKSLAKYWAIFRLQLSNNLAYAGDLLAQSLAIVFFLFVFLNLWRATYSSAGQAGGSIAGLTLADTLWYLMVAEAIVLSRPRLARAIAAAVKDGSIAYLLNKPYNFLLYQLSTGLGEGAARLLFNMLAGSALVWLAVGPPAHPLGLPLALAAIAGSWLIDFCFSSLIGLAAFVTEDVSAFEWIYNKILFLLGGLLIPLDFFPAWLQSIAKALPFAYTVYGPARLFVDPTLERAVWLFAGQAGWLLVLGLLTAALYRRSVAWLNINGG